MPHMIEEGPMEKITVISTAKPQKMTSFITRIREAISLQQNEAATELMVSGMKYYTNRILHAVTPYSKADAGMLSAALRTVAKQLEADNPGADEVRDVFEKTSCLPKLYQIEVIEKANCK